MQAPTIDVLDVVERQAASFYSIRLFLWIAAIMAVEGYDMQLLGYAAPAIVRDWHIAKASLGTAFGMAMAGYMLGALLLSNLGDRFGRRTLVLSGVAVFGAATLAGAYATSLFEMTAWRALAGVGMGGAIPNVMALAAEYAPRRQRATRVAVAFAAYTVGSALGGFIAAWVMPLYGWRAVFQLGGWGALLLGAGLCVALPESVRFMALAGAAAGPMAGRQRTRLLRVLRRLAPESVIPDEAVLVAREEARAPRSHSVAGLFRGGLAATTVLLWLAYICNMVTLHFMTSWLPTVLESGGSSLAHASVATGLFQGGGTVGALLAGRLIDRRGILPLVGAFMLAVPVVAAVGGAVGTVLPAMLLVALAGLCIPGGQCGINALAGTLYPHIHPRHGGGLGAGGGACRLHPGAGAGRPADLARRPAGHLVPAAGGAVRADGHGAAAAVARPPPYLAPRGPRRRLKDSPCANA